tara:strand:- start:35 stop:631 length:597 start_codon:yes stop_codon:yes gene_type:complete
MIKFKNLTLDKPFILFREKYKLALNAGQKNIEAIAISSFNRENNEVDSRYVNVKILDKDKFIFFSNYNSPKSIAFRSNNQIAGLFFWSSINTQIRIKAIIKKTSSNFNQEYFKKRSIEKNALAISSQQSESILSYDDVLKKYHETYKNDDLKKCPEYWGGFSFTPYYFEFWEGHESRLNKRQIFKKINGVWEQSFLQP